MNRINPADTPPQCTTLSSTTVSFASNTNNHCCCKRKMLRPSSLISLPRHAQYRRIPEASTKRFLATTTTNNPASIPFYGLPRPPATNPSTETSLKKRLVLALQSAVTAFRDPTRDDAVAALGEVTGTLALQRILQQMRQHPTGQLLLRDKPVVSKQTIPYEKFLQQAKDNPRTPPDQITFGQAYGRFLLEHGFDPDERKPVLHMPQDTTTTTAEDAEDLAYIMMRYRQCHDYWHTLTGLPPTVLGELGLKWLELFQTGLPIAALSGTVGSLGLPYHQQHILWNHYLPWAIRVHRQVEAKDPHGSILTVYYEQEFDTPLQQLRQRIGMEPAPKVGVIGDEG